MALISDAEYDAMLAAAGDGETVTLGAVSVPCMLGAGDELELEDPAGGRSLGTPSAVLSKPLVVTVRTGALAELKTGAVVTIGSTSYTVDRVLRMRDPMLTHFRAYARLA